jgi:hypothetical protein
VSAEAQRFAFEEAREPADSGWWAAVDRALVWTGDRLNPILVKEARQALKSKQFAMTFGLLLVLGWGWSLLGVGVIGPDIYYGAHGPDMFIGYYVILSFALLVIVPYGAFRSLAGEQEDRTYELLSITTLGPRQIVRGKLGSAVLQMLVYLSAISPCLAFTYMLRGIDFPTILFILFWTVLASLGLAMIGLLIGTVTSEKHWQVVLSVLFIAGLLFVFFTSWPAAAAMLQDIDSAFTESEFWPVNAMILTAHVSFFVLLFYAAAAQITFASDNRSTRLRVTMAVQQLLFIGWMTWVWIGPAEGDDDLIYGAVSMLLSYWFVMGMFLTGESPELSPRVKRSLPQSFFGRAFLTWFNPGPGAGYTFVFCNLATALAVLVVGMAVVNTRGFVGLGAWRMTKTDQILAFTGLGIGYVGLYLGLGFLAIRFLRRLTYVGLTLALVVHPLLVLIGIFVPLVIYWMSDLRYGDYTLLHATNPFWSLAELCDRGQIYGEMALLLILVCGGAAIVAVLNIGGIARELRHVRVSKPKRVAAEDAEREALKTPPKPQPTSPWDDPP